MFPYRLEHADKRNVTDSSSNMDFVESDSSFLTLLSVSVLFNFLFTIFR